MTAPTRRAAIIDGRRTPFLKAGTGLADLDVLALGTIAVREVLAHAEMDGQEVDEIVIGNVSRPVRYHNLAREIGLATLPRTVPAFTVGLACASACQAVTSAADSIERGYAGAVIAGGVESLSNVPIQYSDRLARAVVGASQGKTVRAKLENLAGVRMSDLAPVAPGIRETSTGLTMGQSAELMAKANGISRTAQDELALRSHQNAIAARDACRTSAEVVPVYRPDGRAITADTHPRPDTSLARLAALPPIFDNRHGTITAGNSSPLTDGAAALLLMAESHARTLGYRPRAVIRSYAYAAVDPGDQLLLAPAYAVPVALQRAGLSLSDIGLIEMHEAFAAQVLSTTQALASREFAQRELGQDEAVGEIDPAHLNVNGGSIALGHPFGATGARVLMQLVNEMERRDEQFGLATVCAAGGLGCAVILERV
ncbi:MAG TPA: acetyl-CoA C-acyltransferase [Chloroflexota bacterium]|nr:acetyl-CoA C-acyltransferase [Chloroflexota bacterium]